MIACEIVLLTNVEDIEKVKYIKVQCGAGELILPGEVIRSFVKCANHAYHDYPHRDCLTVGLEFVPPELRPIYEYLYETLKETIIWDEQTALE